MFSVFLAGCSNYNPSLPKPLVRPANLQENPLITELNQLKPLNGPVMTVGVYSFTDKTGQRKPADNIANLSSAVTQGAEVWVIDALLQANRIFFASTCPQSTPAVRVSSRSEQIGRASCRERV